MTQESLITDEERAAIGKERGPFSMEVEKGAMMKVARSVDDCNPMHVDEAAAQKMRYGGLIAHWSYLWFLTYHCFPEETEGARGDTKDPIGSGRRRIHGGDEYEFYEPIRPGDIITATCKIIDMQEKTTRDGRRMVISIRQNDFFNQHNQKVAVQRVTGIRM